MTGGPLAHPAISRTGTMSDPSLAAWILFISLGFSSCHPSRPILAWIRGTCNSMPECVDPRRIGLRPSVKDGGRTAFRDHFPALRARLDHHHVQPPVRRVVRGLRIGTPHRSYPGSPHTPRAHSRDERRKFLVASKPQDQNLTSQQTGGINTGLRPARLDTRQLNGEHPRQGASKTRQLGTIPPVN